MQIFISHDSSDKPLARRIGRALKRVGVGVWLDADSIIPGESWVAAIHRGLEESAYVLVLLTPRAVESVWVRQEVNTAVTRAREGRTTLIPLDIEPCEMPPSWSEYQWVSFRGDFAEGWKRLKETIFGEKDGEGQRRAALTAKLPIGNSSVGLRDLNELNSYARLYDALFSKLSGNYRNYVLNAVIVDQVFQLGAVVKFPANFIRTLFKKSSDGDRMVALLLLQTAPRKGCLGVALEAIERPRSPFEQFHGLRTLELMLHLLEGAKIEQVLGVLKAARREYLVPANLSRWQVYQSIMRKVRQSRRSGKKRA